MNGSGISWPIYKFAPQSTQITTPAPHHSVFYRPNALPAAQPTTLKHWMQKRTKVLQQNQLSSQNSQRIKLKTCYLATYFDSLHTAGNMTTAWCSWDLLWTAYCTCICTQQSQTYTRSQKTKTYTLVQMLSKLCQMLIDFQNSFTIRLSSKFAIVISKYPTTS